MASFSSPLVQSNPDTFVYQSGVVGGVLIGDYVNDSSQTPAGSSENMPQPTLVSTVPVSAVLELQSTTGALLIMRMTTTQRNALTTIANGMMIYNTTTTTFQFYQNGSWVSLSAGAGGVVGPGGGSTDSAVALWDGAGGNTLKNSVVIIDGSGNVNGTNTIANAVGTAALPSYTFTGDTDTGMYHSGANLVSFAADGTRHFEVGGAVVAVNYMQVVGSTTGNPVLINALGSDTNISVEVVPKGTGALLNAVGAVATPSYSFVGRTDTGMWSSAAATVDFSSTGGRNLQIQDSAGTTVNYLTVKGSATSAAVVLGTTGSDSAVNLQLFPKGTTTGQVVIPVGAVATPAIAFLGSLGTGIYNSNTNAVGFAANGLLSFEVASTASTVNRIIASGGATNAGNAALQPGFVAAGSDTNIDVSVTGKATGGLAVLASTTGVAGYLKLWNGAANFAGKLVFAALGQNTTLTMNDIGASTGGIPVATTAFVMKSVAGAAAAGGNAAQSFTDAFCTTGSNVIGNWNTQANPVQVLKIVPGNGSFVVTSTGDAGVGTFNYIITK